MILFGNFVVANLFSIIEVALSKLKNTIDDRNYDLKIKSKFKCA